MKTDDRRTPTSRNRRSKAPARKRSTVWPVLLVVGFVAVAGIGYTLLKDGTLQKIVERVSGGVDSTTVETSNAKSTSGSDSGPRVVVKEYKEPVPKELVLNDEVRSMLGHVSGNMEYIDLGDTVFSVEPELIVSEGNGVQLTGDRDISADLELGAWNIGDALEAAGHADRIDEFAEIAELSVFDQLDIVLTATEKDGIAYDYDVDIDALLAVKRSVMDGREGLYYWELNDAQVMQIGRPGGKNAMRLHVTFLSGKTRGFSVFDRAQHTVHWFVSRLKEPDPETANAIRATWESEDEGLAADAANED